ncbi:MAG: caspase family protein, partial [Planctomycetota bacterium]|nr:caspase family protein [Planctomycetota bacterium]
IDGRLVQIVANNESDPSPDAESQRKKQLVGKLVVDTEKDKAHQTLMIRAFDQVYLNDKRIDINSDQFNLSTFEKEDHVHTDVDSDKSTGRQVQIIHITRPIQETGTIIDIQPKKNAFVFSPARDDESVKSFLVRVPDNVTVEVNEKQIDAGNAPIINLLQPKDYATIRHNVFVSENKRPQGRIIAPQTSIIIIRNMVTDGTIQNIDTAQRTLDIKTAPGNIISIPLDKNCNVFLNGRSQVGDRRFSLSDLRYNDAVSVRHDTLATRISAERTSKSKGIIEKVIPSARKITVSLEEKDAPRMTFSLPSSVVPLFHGKPIDLEELQPTDQIKITYDATDPANPIISELVAQRIPDRKRWAMVIAFADYNDKTLSPVTHLQRDAAHVMETFIDRYRVPQDQTLLITNAVRAELKSKVANFLRRLRSDSELIVYYGGHAYVGTNGQPQLATKSFRLLNADDSGLPLMWLITEIENSAAKEKVLFLDTCHEGSGNDLKDQPSTEEMVMILESDRTNPALRSLDVIASCRSGERGQRTIAGGLFPAAISNAYRGDADKSKDQQITLDEANVFIRDLVSKESKGSQNTALIKPGKIRPPRLSAAVIETMQSLAKKLKQTRVSSDQFANEINSLRAAGGGEPEPIILMGLAAMRVQRWNAARKLFQDVPDQMIAQQGIIWSYFQQRDYRDAINTLITLIESAGREITENKNVVEASRVLEWAGRLREYAGAATAEKDRITDINAEKIDDAARAAGDQANRFYNNGRRYVADKVEDFDDAISDASVKSAKINIRNKKIKLSNYASFNLPLAISQTLRMTESINKN